MPSRADLDAAAAAGLLAPDKVAELQDFLAKRDAGEGEKPPPPAAVFTDDEESLRFVRNFHDVFLAIGIAMLAVGLAIAVAVLAQGLAWKAGAAAAAWATGAYCAIAGAALWALAEAFARRRRLFLPSIALCLTFAGFCVAAALFCYGGFLGAEFAASGWNWNSGSVALRGLAPIAAGAAMLAALGFYARFRLPFSLGLAGSAGAWFLVALVFLASPQATLAAFPPVSLIGGVALFLAGVSFDMRDPQRATRLSDNGFWLHLAAAPLILNGALGLLRGPAAMRVGGAWVGMLAGGANAAQFAAATLAIVLALGFISLLINRRALIVSALLTTGVAVGVLMNAAGLGAGALAASTLIVLGAAVLILGAGWRSLRRRLLRGVKPGTVWARVFPPEAPE